MSTETLERPTETEQPSDFNSMSHRYCGPCNGYQKHVEPHVGMVAVCGHKKVKPGLLLADDLECVVCEDLKEGHIGGICQGPK